MNTGLRVCIYMYTFISAKKNSVSATRATNELRLFCFVSFLLTHAIEGVACAAYYPGVLFARLETTSFAIAPDESRHDSQINYGIWTILQ